MLSTKISHLYSWTCAWLRIRPWGWWERISSTRSASIGMPLSHWKLHKPHQLLESVCQTWSVQTMLDKYSDVSEDTLGTFKSAKAKQLTLQEDSQAHSCKARAVPYALRPKVEEELTRLQNEGILTKVEWSDWATPIVPIPKKDGSVRICGDFKGTVNSKLQAEQYPLPCIEDIFAKLAGGQEFSN